MNDTLQTLYEQDQADRQGFARFDHEQRQRLLQRDAARRERVAALLADYLLLDADDYFHAAMIFQHGETLAHFWRAHQLAHTGAMLGHPAGLWLMAAAYDRWLMGRGHPQKYGTQYLIREGRWVLYEVDPTTTDAQRARWNVPPLAHSLHRAEELNHTVFVVTL